KDLRGKATQRKADGRHRARRRRPRAGRRLRGDRQGPVTNRGQMTIHLARHGQTAYNHEGRFQGHLAVPLDATGREQAAELAEAATKIEAATLWCSPLARARE